MRFRFLRCSRGPGRQRQYPRTTRGVLLNIYKKVKCHLQQILYSGLTESRLKTIANGK